mmetsp:Transcript_22238/g.30474  ORF Transcript_22238/g.30474 Transcript_22238/m.30474 type:complete len:271 (+) Transcript_22238:74-886(+)
MLLLPLSPSKRQELLLYPTHRRVAQSHARYLHTVMNWHRYEQRHDIRQYSDHSELQQVPRPAQSLQCGRRQPSPRNLQQYALVNEVHCEGVPAQQLKRSEVQYASQPPHRRQPAQRSPHRSSGGDGELRGQAAVQGEVREGGRDDGSREPHQRQLDHTRLLRHTVQRPLLSQHLNMSDQDRQQHQTGRHHIPRTVDNSGQNLSPWDSSMNVRLRWREVLCSRISPIQRHCGSAPDEEGSPSLMINQVILLEVPKNFLTRSIYIKIVQTAK